MQIPDELILATENVYKGKELTDILMRFLPQNIIVKTLADVDTIVLMPEETGLTFCENAKLKAESVSRTLKKWAIGDDSGLCVSCLEGAPGIYSRRWSGIEDTDEARNELLLKSITESGASDRNASFVCCVAIAGPGMETITATGVVEGTILNERRGNSGFGYDPLFLIDGMDKTLAEVGAHDKNSLSHRANAIKNLIRMLQWSPSSLPKVATG